MTLEETIHDLAVRAKAAGEEVPIAPLSEVADLCVDAIRRDVFWATAPSERTDAKIRQRSRSQLERSSPDYLLETTLMARSAAERDGE